MGWRDSLEKIRGDLGGRPDEFDALLPCEPGVLRKVRRRRREILAARPEPALENTNAGFILLPRDGRYCPLVLQREAGCILLIFTSLYHVLDYLQADPDLACATPGGASLAKVAGEVALWKESGVTDVAFNRCPRCGAGFTARIDQVDGGDKLLRAWATTVASRQVAVEGEVARALQEKDAAAQRRILEHVRDHVDPGVPEVHFLLGVNALRRGDDGLFEEAYTALAPFGDDWLERLREEQVREA